MFTAYSTHARDGVNARVLGDPFFGILVTVLAGLGTYTAMAATDGINQQFDEAVLAGLCPLAPPSHIAHRGRWAAKATPFVFGAQRLLALLVSLQH